MTEKEISTIFCGISHLKPVNEELMALLTTKFEANPVVEEVGGIFLQMVIITSHSKKKKPIRIEFTKRVVKIPS